MHGSPGPETVARRHLRQRLLRVVLQALDASDGVAVPLPRAALEDLLTLLGAGTRRPCRLCGTVLLTRTTRAYCSDACRSKAWRLRRGWTPKHPRPVPVPDLWDEMGTVLRVRLAHTSR